MKKIIYSFILSLTAIAFVGCDMNNPNEDKFGVDAKSGWVGFENPGSLYDGIAGCGLENEIRVPIVLNAPVNDGLDVTYTITDVVGTSAGSITSYASVPAGSRNGNLVITYPETQATSLEFTVTLTGTSRSNVFIGSTTTSDNGIDFPDTDVDQTVRIRVNTGSRDRFLGIYDVVETSADGTFEYVSVIERGTADNELIVSNLFDSNPNSQTRVFLNNDGTVSYPAFADNLLFTTSTGNPVFFQGLDGTASTPCEGVLEFDFNLRVGPTGAGTVGPVNVVLTRR